MNAEDFYEEFKAALNYLEIPWVIVFFAGLALVLMVITALYCTDH